MRLRGSRILVTKNFENQENRTRRPPIKSLAPTLISR